MVVKAYSCVLHGVDAMTITIETSIHGKGLYYATVGLADGSLKETMNRAECAIVACKYWMPRTRVVINLSPADVKKSGTGLELAMTLSILSASGQLKDHGRLAEYVILGEMGLDGTIHPIKGSLSMAVQARKEGFKGLIVPEANAKEAGMVTKLPVYPVNHLKDVIEFLSQARDLTPISINARDEFHAGQFTFDVDFADVKGQENIKRALEIAAAGGHNAVLIGPPGSGKTMLAQRLPTILPPLSLHEALETTKVYSAAGKLPDFNNCLVNKRPFRSPHHTISNIALVGGGSLPQPGEISLAHNGILFLDELPEFSRHVLETMRQPMEDRKVLISRAMRTLEFPSNFMLIASMNPCPCGYFNHPERDCDCAESMIHKYLSKISGPLMDRIDLHVEVQPLPLAMMNEEAATEKSQSIRIRVVRAREIQSKRYNQLGLHSNSQMTRNHLKEFCALDKDSETLLYNAMARHSLSARAYDRILKVARTIADLAGSKQIDITHLTEAIQYRSLDKENFVQPPVYRRNMRVAS